MNKAISSQRPQAGGRRDGLIRLARRVCVLRAQDDTVGAERLRAEEFLPELHAWRSEDPAAAPGEAEVDEWFAREAERVADATVLAELLVPRLAAALANNSALRAVAEPPRVATPPPRPVSVPQPQISDLLDAMLAAERPNPQLSPARNR